MRSSRKRPKSAHPPSSQTVEKIRDKPNPRPNKKAKYGPIKFETLSDDPIVENLKQISKHEQHNDIDAEVLDHIALEGLGGITFERLLNILNAIDPSLNCLQDEKSQLYVWTTIVNKYFQRPAGAGIRAYHFNPRARKQKSRNDSDLPQPNAKNVVLDSPIKLPSLAWKRVSKTELTLYPIQDGTIMGSCENYLQRLDITQDILDKFQSHGAQASLHEINNQYDLKNICFVADQDLRRRAIFPDWADPNIDMKLREYVCLEFIGKTRLFGAVFPNDKSFGRYRIILFSKGFITQYQQHVHSHIIHHLKRFVQSNLKHIDNATFNKKGILPEERDDDTGPSIKKACCNPYRLKSDHNLLRMVYDVIAQRNGRSALDIRRKLKIPKSHVRNHLKNLVNIELVGSHTRKIGDNIFRMYRTRYKSIKLKKRKAEVQKLKGVMSRWDEIDVKAKNILGHKRSSFSQAEDSLLILCRIVSLLIEPGLKKLSFCVNKRFIRNLMHEEFVESHDKTADACLRRIKYLRRLPHNMMSINELTAELRDDPDIIRLIESKQSATNEDRQNQLFIQVLRTVRSKLPYLLGLSTSLAGDQGTGIRRNTFHRMSGEFEQNDRNRDKLMIKDEKELREMYELVDCQSVTSISRAPTYDPPKNVVDVKLNNVCLVTMAFALANNLETAANRANQQQKQLQNEASSNDDDKKTEIVTSVSHQVSNTDHDDDDDDDDGSRTSDRVTTNATDQANTSSSSANPVKRRASLWLLDKFYSNYQDKLICSVLSKLNKRSLLTRKCPLDQATLYRPIKTRTSLKLNQSVLFLLNRYHSSSLMQLAHPISQEHRIDLSESNEMASIALLTSLYSQSSFNLDLRLKIPVNVIGLDQGNECEDLSDTLIVQPCNIKFYSEEQFKLDKKPLEEYLERSKPIDVSNEGEIETTSPARSTTTRAVSVSLSKSSPKAQQQGKRSNWLVKGFRLPGIPSLSALSTAINPEDELEASKKEIEFEARLWKSIDGSVHIGTLFKLIESLLSWIIVLPGVELEILYRELGHLMPLEHLIELLELMENLKLISSTRLDEFENNTLEPHLFGYSKPASEEAHQRVSSSSTKSIITYEPQANAYVQYCRQMHLRG